jgi:hypothetical protein
MATSQNGYKANDASLIAGYTIARDVKINLRKGDVSVVLLHFARWYDQHIEPLTAKDTGGYNPRDIIGSNVLSNHASGTAEDLRWNKHPMGKEGTFTAGQAAKIREQLKFYDGVIRWGGDYTARKDEMHYEINKAPAAVTAVANKIRGEASTTPSGPKPPTKPAALVVDGKLGPATIKRWQQVMGTPVDGEIDDKHSELIKAVQRKLKATVNSNLSVDGDFGRHTVAALQKYLGSPLDGFISTPKSQMVIALQRRLNTGKF